MVANTSAVVQLPGQVLFQVTLMRELMKIIGNAPLNEAISAVHQMNEQLDLLFFNATEADEELKSKG
jgi:hypothetical protein